MPWASVASLPSLKQLLLDHNSLTTLPAALFQACALRVLDCSSNRLERLPEDVRLLTSLEELDVTSNDLISLPDALGASLGEFPSPLSCCSHACAAVLTAPYRMPVHRLGCTLSHSAALHLCMCIDLRRPWTCGLVCR